MYIVLVLLINVYVWYWYGGVMRLMSVGEVVIVCVGCWVGVCKVECGGVICGWGGGWGFVVGMLYVVLVRGWYW